MRCSQLETRLNQLLDERLDPRRDPIVAEHAAHCDRCRRVTAAYAALADGATDLVAIESARPASAVGLTSAAGALLAVAAAALLMFTAQRPEPGFAVVAPAVGQAEVAPRIAAANEAEATVTRRAPVVAELARNTGRAYVDFVYDTARGGVGAFTLASSLPPPSELLDPVLFPEDGLLRQFETEWVPAAGQTFNALGELFADDRSRQL